MLDCTVSDCPKKFLTAQIPLSNRFDILSCDDLEESLSEFDEVSLSITNIKKLLLHIVDLDLVLGMCRV